MDYAIQYDIDNTYIIYGKDRQYDIVDTSTTYAILWFKLFHILLDPTSDIRDTSLFPRLSFI